MIYTGDILLKQLDDGTWDWFFENGQPEMTNGLETMSMLAVFGEAWWGNGITKKESEKMKSKFPEVIRRNVVTDKTKNDGTKAIEEALSVFTTEKIAKSVTITGEIFSAYGIQWIANIEALTDKSLKYFINWEKGVLTAGFVTGEYIEKRTEGIYSTLWDDLLLAYGLGVINSGVTDGVPDSSGNGNDGTATDVVISDDGVSAVFNGSSSFIDCGDIAGDFIGKTFTFHVKRDVTIGLSETILCYGAGALDKLSIILDSNGKITFFYRDGVSTIVESVGSSIADNASHFISFSAVDSTTLRFTIDNITYADITVATMSTRTGSGLTIGRLSAGAGSSSFLDGTLDNFRIYNRILTSDEITELYTRGL